MFAPSDLTNSIFACCTHRSLLHDKMPGKLNSISANTSRSAIDQNLISRVGYFLSSEFPKPSFRQPEAPPLLHRLHSVAFCQNAFFPFFGHAHIFRIGAHPQPGCRSKDLVARFKLFYLVTNFLITPANSCPGISFLFIPNSLIGRYSRG